MLRVMKEKAESITRPDAGLPTSDSVRDTPPTTTESVEIADVPRNISIGSTMEVVSSDSSTSSYSSDGCHPLASLTRVSDNETASMGLRAPSASLTVPKHAERISNESSDPGAKATVEKRKFVSQPTQEPSEHGCPDVDDVSSPSRKKCRVSVDSEHTSRPSLRLLGGPGDAEVLKPLHAFVRMQIEVFTATPEDIAQPSPGRKKPIKLHQVGLRCIHCRSLSSRDRVKRAVCYPSKVARVYHSVSDMKFDHFGACRGLPEDARAKFEELKVQGKGQSDKNGSKSSTALYYRDAALRMGMVDHGDAIFMADQNHERVDPLPHAVSRNPNRHSLVERLVNGNVTPTMLPSGLPTLPFCAGLAMSAFHPLAFYARQLALSQNLSLAANNNGFAHALGRNKVEPLAVSRAVSTSGGSSVASSAIPSRKSSIAYYEPSQGNVLLASSLDEAYLNPLHCFVRRNVEIFVATSEDAAAPAPGRKTRVSVGQVGIRCIHCTRLPQKDRVKRSVCYPPSLSGIYHAVSNIKFDHFPLCKGMPAETRTEFESLRNASNRRNCLGSLEGTHFSSTSQFYQDSASRLGLVDTTTGIRFPVHLNANDSPSPVVLTPELSPAKQAEAHAGISALMIAATTPREELTVGRALDEKPSAVTQV